MPYGAARHAKLVAKVGNGDNPKRSNVGRAGLAPYGSAEYRQLVAKTGGMDQPKIDDAQPRVVRLSKAGS
jgi:hypothetical protein